MRILLKGRGPKVAAVVTQLAVDLSRRGKVAVLYTHREELDLLRRHGIRGYNLSEIRRCGQLVLDRVWHDLVSGPSSGLEFDGVRLREVCEYDRIRHKITPQQEIPFLKSNLGDLLAVGAMLSDFRPSVMITWNGVPAEMKMALALARRAGTRTFCMERGLLPDSLVIDPLGVNAQSILCTEAWDKIAAQPPERPVVEQIHNYLDRIHNDERSVVLQDDSCTCEELRARFGILPHRRIVLVPEQIDWDTNVVYNAGRYRTNEDVLRQIIAAIENAGDYAVLYKPHPENPDRGNAAGLLHGIGHVATNANINSLLKAADLVVVRNSTVGLEAVGYGKPVVVLGKAVWSHKGFTYDVSSQEEFKTVFDRALAAGFTSRMRRSADTFFAHIIQRRHYFRKGSEPLPEVNRNILEEILSAEPSRPVSYPAKVPMRRALARSRRRALVRRLVRRTGLPAAVDGMARTLYSRYVKPELKRRDHLLARLTDQSELLARLERLERQLQNRPEQSRWADDRPVENAPSVALLTNEPDVDAEIPGRAACTDYFLRLYRFATILDVGCGRGTAFGQFVAKGTQVTGIDILSPELVTRQIDGGQIEYIREDFMRYNADAKYDAVFCSHVVEHMPDTERFLRKLFSFVKPGGAFCIIWPPPKSTVVGGHVHCFNMGMMLYNLVRLGIDCRGVSMVQCDYSLAVMGRYQTFTIPQLTHDSGDIERLAGYFPCQAYQCFDGTRIPGTKHLTKEAA